MYRILKYKWEDRSKLFFSSDWHIFHDPKWDVPIWKMRGYSNVEDAAKGILEKINNTLQEDSVLYFLGDMFLNATDEQCLNWLSEIKCKTYHTDEIEVYPFSHKNIPNIEFMGNHLEIQVGKKRIILNHFPIRIWNGCHRTSWHLSGHSHLNDPNRRPEFPLGKALDIGIDSGKIWSFEEIEEIMSTKTVELIDHHDKDTN
jgi:calcineurin-like phosphoesterase family protein